MVRPFLLYHSIQFCRGIMKLSLQILFRGLVILSTALMPVLCLSQGVQLVAPATEGAVASKRGLSRLDQIKRHPQRVVRGLVRLNRSALDSTWIAFAVPGGENYQIQELRRTHLKGGLLKYEGLVNAKEGARFSLFVNGDDLYGSIITPDHQYIIEWLDGDFFAVSEVDQTKPPPNAEGPGGLPPTPAEQRRKDTPISKGLTPPVSSQAASSTAFDILFLYTSAAAAANGSISTQSAWAVDNTRRAIIQSSIQANTSWAGALPIVFTERNDLPIQDRLLAELDGIIQNPQAQQARDAAGADIVVLISASGGFDPNFCGWAKLRPTADYAYIAISQACLGTLNILPHEVGHIFGADHNVENQTLGNDIPYAHGTRSLGNPNGGYCYFTTMAYVLPCANGVSPSYRIGQLEGFSRPAIGIHGISLGNAFTQDNSRVISEQASIVAAFRGPSGDGGGTGSGGGTGPLIVPLLTDLLFE